MCDLRLTGEVGLETSFGHEFSHNVDRLSSGAHGQQLDQFGVVETLQRLNLLHKLVLLRVLCREMGENTVPSERVLCQTKVLLRSPGSPTLLQHLYGHFPVLRGPHSFPHLSKVTLSQLLVKLELLSRSFPRLHVEELPLHRDDRVRPNNSSTTKDQENDFT